MPTRLLTRRLLPWVGVVLLSIASAFGAVEIARALLEHNQRNELNIEVKRRAGEIMAATMNGNVMGSVATIGLVSSSMKMIALGEMRLEDPQAMDVLRSVGEAYQATGVYVVNRDGIIQSNWYTAGRSLTGVDVKFRPYFQIAMLGKQNVYAAIGTTTGLRALYFAAPLYDSVSARSPIVGATVIRLDVDRVDSVLNAWKAPALLLSPQQIAFASNQPDWVEQIAQETTPEQLKAIRALKQFGNTFETGAPKTLPFDIRREVVSIEHRRYAVNRAPVQWNDPHGEWTLVLMSDLDALMPLPRRIAIGAACGAAVLLLGALFLVWRRRLQHANAERQRAIVELKAHTGQLESDSATKSFLSEISADLHQASSLAEFAEKLMRRTAPRIEADYGAFYVFDEESRLLTPVGGYGALAQGLTVVAVGQGLVGQCAKDRTLITISNAADTDIRVLWGEGVAEPQAIILLPVVQTDRVLAVIVLAALRPIDADKRALLEAMAPMVAANLEILERNLGTQRQAELLQRQQARLQETEAWYRSVIESAPDGMLVVDEQGVIAITNPQIDTMFGYAAGTLLGEKIEVLVPPAARSRHPGLRESFFQSGNMRVIKELRGVRQDGSEFPVEIGLSRLPALGGRGPCVCASVRDISERMRAEESIRRANEEQTAIFESATLGIAFIKDRLIVRGNSKLNELFGFSSEEQIGQSTRIWYPDDEAYAAGGGGVYEELKRGQTHQRDQVLQRKDGSRFWCRLSGRAVDAGDLARGTVWMLEDITERKQSEQAIAEERARLQAIIDTSPICLAFTTKGRFQFINPAFGETFGVKAGDDASQIYVHPEDRAELIERLQRDGIVKNQEYQMLDGQKRVRDMLATFMPINYGGEDGVLGWLLDVTERKKIEDIERFNRLALGREQRVVELKREVNALAAQAGKAAPYAAPEHLDDMETAGVPVATEAAADEEASVRHEFVELLQRENLKELFDGYCEAVGIAAAIIDLDAKVLASSRWQRVCTDFHRVGQRSCANCIESDTGLAMQLQEGQDFTMYRCKNGMTDCAAPIFIDGHHVANVFIGQFHLQPPDLAFFRNQAGEFGFDAERYVAAVQEAPVMDESKLPHILGFLARFARLIGSFAMEQRRTSHAEQAAQRRSDDLRQERIAALSVAEDAEKARQELTEYKGQLEQLVADRTRELERVAAEVRQNEERLRGLLEGSPAAVTIVTEDGVQLFSNRRLADMLGVPLETMPRRRTTEFWADPEDRVAFIEKFKREGKLDDYEARFRRDDGGIIWVLLNTRWIEQGGQRLLISWLYDITERKNAEDELKDRMQELERFGRLTIDREEKMIQLKGEINGLLEQMGREAKYKIVG